MPKDKRENWSIDLATAGVGGVAGALAGAFFSSANPALAEYLHNLTAGTYLVILAVCALAFLAGRFITSRLGQLLQFLAGAGVAIVLVGLFVSNMP